MKLIIRVFLIALLIVIISPILVLGYFGFIPGVSSLFGSDRPRDLKIRYNEADHQAARLATKVEYGKLPAGTFDSQNIVRSGTHAVTMELTSAQATSLMNNRPWAYWPYKDVQVKFNADGSSEISGVLLKSKVPSYAGAIGIPKEAVEFAMKFLPVDPVFYLKMRASLSENKVDIFDPQRFEIGRVPLPVNLFLSSVFKPLVHEVYAIDIAGMAGELGKLSDKRSLIIGYINGRLASYESFFYAKKAYFGDNKLVFDGRLANKESTVQGK